MSQRDITLKDHQHPYDVALVVKDGKEFQAHRDVLSQASPFFEKLLNSDMKENNEGIIRLEMIKESQMVDILQFIYTGDVRISSQENAEKLIEIADYLLLSNLKAFVGKCLEQHMTSLNCISIYHFAEKFLCEDLIASTRKFICSNFSTVAASNDFLKFPSHEVEKFISSDEIVIDVEENVFEIILRWTEHAKSERSGIFSELFRHVRLTCVSRDFLVSDVVTNDLVKENEDCLQSVTAALQWIDRPADCNVSRPHPPRKAMERDVMVVTLCSRKCPRFHTNFYLPATEEWYSLPPFSCHPDYVISHGGKVFVVTTNLADSLCYDPDLNRWSPAPWTKLDSNLEDNREFMKLYPGAFQVQYVLVVKNQICFIGKERKKSVQDLTLWRYNTDSNSVTPLFNWAQKLNFCSVVVDKYIYVIGGNFPFAPFHSELDVATVSAAKFDTEENTWQEIAPLQEARLCALGVSKNIEKIFIAGGFGNSDVDEWMKTCEVYNILTDEWQFIASLIAPPVFGKMVLIDETIYVLGGGLEKPSVDTWSMFPGSQVIMVSYDHERDKWNERIIPDKEVIFTLEDIWPFSDLSDVRLDICSLRLFKFIEFSNLEPIQY